MNSGPGGHLAEIGELMNRARQLPYGEAKSVMIEDALRRAEAAADEVTAFHVRMELTSAYQHGGEPAQAFTTFSRCLAEHDRDPARFDQGTRLLWHFKWIVNSLTLFPEVPLDRTYAVLDDMERRYRLSGHSLQAVFHYRHLVARHVGDEDAADAWFARWLAAPRDDLSDCEGCDPTGRVRHLVARGRYEEALRVAVPVLSRQLSCTEQPQNILTALMTCYLGTGRLEEARTAHRQAYRLVRGNRRGLAHVAEHIEFCVLTGNEARGLELLERHLEWLDRAPSPHAAMRFSAAGARLLRRLDEAGHTGVVLRRDDRQLPAAELAGELEGFALSAAELFDARNGTSHQGDSVRETLAMEPLEHLPLTPYARRPAPRPPAGSAVAGGSADDPAELLDQAEERWALREIGAALALWRRFDELVPGSPPDGLAGRRADGRGHERMLGGDTDGAVAEWERAARLHAEAGDRLREYGARGRIGAALCAHGRVDEGLELLLAALAGLEEVAPGSEQAFGTRMRLAVAYAESGGPVVALGLLQDDRLVPPTRLHEADLELARARTMAQLGREDEAVAALRRACDGYRKGSAPGALAEVALMLAQRLMRDPPPEDGADEAMELLNEAVAHAPAEVPALRPAAYATRGNRMLDYGRFADAAEDLIEAVAGFTAAGAHDQAAYARVDLAAALLSAGRYLEAAEVAEEAVPALRRLDDPGAEHRSRYLLAHAQRELGEEDAAETFAALAADQELPGVAAELLESAGDVLTGLDRDGPAAERFLAAAERFAAVGDPVGAVRARRRGAMCLGWAGRTEEGLAQIAQARAALADLPADGGPPVAWETALVAYDEARLLAGADRFTEALVRLDEALTGFEALGDDSAVAAARALRQDIRARLN